MSNTSNPISKTSWWRVAAVVIAAAICCLLFFCSPCGSSASMSSPVLARLTESVQNQSTIDTVDRAPTVSNLVATSVPPRRPVTSLEDFEHIPQDNRPGGTGINRLHQTLRDRSHIATSINTSVTPLGVEYHRVLGERHCQCHQPFIGTYHAAYDAILAAKTSTAPDEKIQDLKRNLFEPSEHLSHNFLRHFSEFWFDEVRSYESQHHQTSSGTSTLPEARVLFIGDSVLRNAYHRLLTRMVRQGLAESDEYENLDGGYHVISITWPQRHTAADGTASKQPEGPRAKLFFRYEYQPYLASDSPDINDSGAADFNPTHVIIDRGLWDVVHAVPHDPSWPLASFSAGLVKLRQRLLLNRMKLAKEGNTARIPPLRMLYFAMPKTYGPSEGATIRDEVQHCTMNSDSLPFRDALYCAVRRANGALAMIHKRGADVVCPEMLKALGMSSTNEEALRVCREHVSSFSSFGIELLDTYGPSLAASVTRMPDGMHPNAALNDFLTASLFNQLQQPPQPLPKAVDSVRVDVLGACREFNSQELSGSALASCVKALIHSSQMYMPPPLYETTGKHNCPLAMALADAEAIWNSPFGSIVEPPPLFATKEQLMELQATFTSQVSCHVPHDGDALHSVAAWVLTTVNIANARTPLNEPAILPWRQLFQKCVTLSIVWFRRRGSFGNWAPATRTSRVQDGAFKRLSDANLGLPAHKHVVVHASGRMCSEMLANLTRSDFNEIWAMALNGTISCYTASVASSLAQPPGSRVFDVDAKLAAQCIKNEKKND